MSESRQRSDESGGAGLSNLAPTRHKGEEVFGAVRDQGVPTKPIRGRAGVERLANAWRNDVDFITIYSADPIDRIEMGKAGVPATAVSVMARQLKLTNDRFMRLIGLAPATVKRKAKTASVLARDDSSRMIGLASLVGQVTQIVQQSGNPDGFDAGQWVAEWMDEPIPALGNRKPSELMDTSEGQALVSDVIARMQSGAYS